MKKNGFTLIELLAVIVILAIIALIAVPIILNIIDDAEEKSAERSIELYASAVKNAVATYQLDNPKAPKQFSDLTIEYDGDVECTKKELYSDKTFYLGGCKINKGKKEYTYGTRQYICSIEQQDKSKYSVGDVVTCKLTESTDKFYVVEEQPLTATSIQMLAEKNISTTTFRQSDDAGTIMFAPSPYWQSYLVYPSDDYPAYVYNHARNLIKPIVDKYVEYLNTKFIVTTGGLLTLPQAENLGCVKSSKTCSGAPSWVYSTNYWLGTVVGPNNAMYIHNDGRFIDLNAYTDKGNVNGVRPLITIATEDVGK